MKKARLFFFFWLIFAPFSLKAASLVPADTAKNQKISRLKMAFGYPHRAGDFEENLFKDFQLIFNASWMHSAYDLSNYFTDDWLLQENDLLLSVPPNRADASRKFSRDRLAVELTGSLLFFYAGLGMAIPTSSREIDLGRGRSFYTGDSCIYTAQLRKGSYWKAGLQLHFRKWLFYGGIKGYDGFKESSITSENLKTGTKSILTGAGSGVFNNFIEFGINFENLSIRFEKALNIDFPGAESNSFSIGYNLFNLRNFNEKRIPR